MSREISLEDSEELDCCDVTPCSNSFGLACSTVSVYNGSLRQSWLDSGSPTDENSRENSLLFRGTEYKLLVQLKFGPTLPRTLPGFMPPSPTYALIVYPTNRIKWFIQKMLAQNKAAYQSSYSPQPSLQTNRPVGTNGVDIFSPEYGDAGLNSPETDSPRELPNDAASDVQRPRKRSKVEREGDNDIESDRRMLENAFLLRRQELEGLAEKSAEDVYRKWQQDGKTLKDAIDESLKEYIELYEKAHALRLKFDAEKNEWMRKTNDMIRDSRRQEFRPATLMLCSQCGEYRSSSPGNSTLSWNSSTKLNGISAPTERTRVLNMNSVTSSFQAIQQPLWREGSMVMVDVDPMAVSAADSSHNCNILGDLLGEAVDFYEYMDDDCETGTMKTQDGSQGAASTARKRSAEEEMASDKDSVRFLKKRRFQSPAKSPATTGTH